jgi:predicted lipoprotein with Yx(FWY)xxD motif
MVNGKGFTLYRFDADSAKPSASHCTGACAVIWSAVPATGANNVQGVDHQLVGSVNRPGSSAKQLTIAGWPMYTYSQDSKPGQTNGQGVDGTWFAVAPTGAKAASSGSGTMPGSGTSGGGYGY